MTTSKSISAFILALGLCGCASATWTYNGKEYESSAAAIEAAREDIRLNTSAVSARSAPAAGKALVLVPTVGWARRSVLATGNPPEEHVRFVATVMYYGFHGMAESLQRRRIFSATHIEEFAQRDPLGNPSYDFIIWLRLDSPDAAQWMIAPGADTSRATPLFVSPISEARDRMLRFVESVERHVSERQS